MYCTFKRQRLTLSVMYIYWHRLALSPRIVRVPFTGTRWLYVYTVLFSVSHHLRSVRFMYVWQDQILVRPEQWRIRTTSTWNFEATSEPGNYLFFLFFWWEVGVGKLSEWLDLKLTLQKKTVTCTSSPYVAWKLADKSSKFLEFKVANLQ
jgi:hypothetical protein